MNDFEDDAPSICPGCGGTFVCGMKEGRGRCWCADLPRLPPPPEAGKGCYCPDCLRKRLVEAGIIPC